MKETAERKKGPWGINGDLLGIKAFILDKIEDGVSESMIVKKLRKHYTLDEKTASRYCRTCIK